MASGNGRVRRVIIVDNSRTMQAITEDAFEKTVGFQVVGVAGEVAAGADLVRRLAPDVVTIGLTVAGADGAASIEPLLAAGAACTVVVSDHAARDVVFRNRLEALGATLCVGKRDLTEAPDAFFRKIARACDRAEEKARHPAATTAVEVQRPTAAPIAHFGYPVPRDEERRIALLARKQLGDAARERLFDLVTRHVAEATGFPVCLLTFIDRDTQWIKSAAGYDRPSVPRAYGFCNYALASEDLFVVRDASTDSRFAGNPLVTGEPHIRSYAGQPIALADGTQVGTLCVLDSQVRTVDAEARRCLLAMAEILGEVIEHRPALAA